MNGDPNPGAAPAKISLSVRNLVVSYGDKRALGPATMDITCLLYTSPSPRDCS